MYPYLMFFFLNSDIAVSGRKLPKAWSVHSNVWLTDSECEQLKLIAELLCIENDYFKLDLLMQC